MDNIIKIPYERLKSDILQAIIEEFVTREGTDYGGKETPLKQKIKQVEAQLKKGQAIITYDEQTQTCNIVPKEKYSSSTRNNQ